MTSLEVYEDTLVHFESRVEPYEDPDLICEWYKDGVQLNSANRIGLFFNFGYVGLDIKGARTTGKLNLKIVIKINFYLKKKRFWCLYMHS